MHLQKDERQPDKQPVRPFRLDMLTYCFMATGKDLA